MLKSSLRTRLRAAALLAALGCTGAGALAAAPSPASSASSTEPPALRLEASASREVPQDMAWASLVVEREGRSAAQAQRDTAADLAQAVARAKAVSQLEVRTESFYTAPLYGKDGKISSWRSRAELRIDSSAAAVVAQTAAELASVARLAATGFYLSPAARARAEQDLIAEAVREFQAKTQATAQALGFAQTELREVAVGQSGFEARPPASPMRAMAMAAEARSAEPVPMEPGKTHVSVSVSGAVALRR